MSSPISLSTSEYKLINKPTQHPTLEINAIFNLEMPSELIPVPGAALQNTYIISKHK